MGDFYELFYDDAKKAAEAVGLTLTSRDKNQENPVAMAGFPYHQLEGYLGKLIRLGFRVAICEQVEDPKEAKGIVKREVTRVVSPGTLTDEELLDPRESNYLAAIYGGEGNERIGISWVELSTGRFFAATIPTESLVDELYRVSPSECLVSDAFDIVPDYMRQNIMLTQRPAWQFGKDAAIELLTKQFSTKRLDGFGFEDRDSEGVRAAGAILAYLEETQKTSLDHIDRLVPHRSGVQLEIDESTRRSLELTRTIRDGGRDGSLLSVIDKTVTAMGYRLLADWLANPLTEIDNINGRLDGVEELLNDIGLCDDLRVELKAVYDTERLVSRVTTGRASPRDLSFISKTLAKLPRVKARLTARTSDLLQTLEAELDLCPDLRSRLDAALVEDCPLVAKEGGFVREGFNDELDQLRQLATGGKEWIAKYQAAELERTGISSLKVGFNKVFGYYLEVTNAHKDKVPEEYIRKQTLKNAERYITPELKEYEEKVLSADDKAKQLEYDVFCELRDLVHVASQRLQTTALVLSQLDVLCGLAELARKQNYCRPTFTNHPDMEIIDGRHPVLDIVEPEGTFVPNDASASEEAGRMLLITGPNMAGKSTYIRQVALIALMAQMGSFVPAKKATLGIADRIFARVGASDELSRGQSTFMVEMTETARILNTATRQSLVILDEIGRGTSTYDGLSLAWAIVEHLHDNVGCRTLFATHYHELTQLQKSLVGVNNLNVAVKEWDDNVVFLHKIVEGAADKSYGIHVARLAGVPGEVNERAKQILAQLEDQHLRADGAHKAIVPPPHPKRDMQLTLFGPAEHPLLDQIRELNCDQMTPIDALMTIQKWKESLAEGS